MKAISRTPLNRVVAAAGTEAKWSSGCSNVSKHHGEPQYERYCDTGSLAMCKMLALVLWESAISPVPGAGDIPVHLPADTPCQPAGCYPFLTYSSFHSYHQSLVFVSYRAGVDAYFPVCLHRLNKIQQSLKESYSVQITEALLSETGDIRRFIQRAVEH